MAWGRIKCLDCGHSFDSEAEALKAMRKIQGPVGGPVQPFLWHTEITAVDPSPRCPRCNLAQRDARWPAAFVLVPLFFVWLATLAALVAGASEKIPLAAVMPFLWVSGGLSAAGLVATIVFYSIAKPIRC
jgi:DNA-directed RNA polymerase subunit RPC12/RpoP